MAICSGDCQDQGCKMIAECERVYKASSPPCAELVEEKFTSTNIQSAPCSCNFHVRIITKYFCSSCGGEIDMQHGAHL